MSAVDGASYECEDENADDHPEVARARRHLTETEARVLAHVAVGLAERDPERIDRAGHRLTRALHAHALAKKFLERLSEIHRRGPEARKQG